MVRWWQPFIWNKSVDGVICAWSNTFPYCNWNVWVICKGSKILTNWNFRTWVYLNRIWTWFWILVQCKRYCMLYLLLWFFPSGIGKKFRLGICNLFWCKWFNWDWLNGLIWNWNWWTWDYSYWRMTLERRMTLWGISYVRYIWIYSPILIFLHVLPLNIRLGVVGLMF
jgi:hypothetical protein